MADQIKESDKELCSDFLKSQRMEVEEAEERTRKLLEKLKVKQQEDGNVAEQNANSNTISVNDSQTDR